MLVALIIFITIQSKNHIKVLFTDEYFIFSCFYCFILFKVVHCKEKCRDFFDAKGFYRTMQFCDSGLFCCGDCLNRYCCANSSDKLEEDFCKNLFNYDLL